jgi:hypothetical protein
VVTVRAVDREGKSVPVSAAFQSPASDAVHDTLSSGHAARVPAGSYVVAAWVWEPDRVAAKIAATAHTYTLEVEATRPGGGISKSVTASYTFTAKAGNTSLQTSNFSPRMLPQNLSASNAAAAGSTTSVPITFSTVNGVIAAHDVAVWASSNGGKTWSALKVAHHGSTWTVSVANPKAAGYVSLRVQGEDAAGSKTEVTVIDAYGVS